MSFRVNGQEYFEIEYVDDRPDINGEQIDGSYKMVVRAVDLMTPQDDDPNSPSLMMMVETLVDSDRL